MFYIIPNYPGSTDYIRPFIVTPDGKPFTTFEGMRIIPHYSFDNVPLIDILVIPSTKTSLTDDLENTELLGWIKTVEKQASYVVTLCWGAFPLAATGALDGHSATTFPFDRQKLSKMFPNVRVRYGVNFVVDGKYITSVGGHPSHEPMLYLVEKIYSPKFARSIAKELVMDWDLREVSHIVVRRK